MQITVDIPDHLLPQYDSGHLAQQLKLHTALLLFQSGHLSQGAACEFASIDRYEFLAACQQYHINTLTTTIDEIEGDVSRFQQLQQTQS